MFKQYFHGLFGAFMPHPFPRRVPGVVFVQTFLNTGFGPIRQRFKRTNVRLLFNRRRFTKNVLGLLSGFLPGAFPDKASLDYGPRKHMFLERKVKNVVHKNHTRLQQLLKTSHVYFSGFIFWDLFSKTHSRNRCYKNARFMGNVLQYLPQRQR